MFKKPFVIKSQSLVGKSDKKKCVAQLSQQFVGVSVEDWLPIREPIYAVKIVCHDNSDVILYCVKNEPMVFELEHMLYPTVYALWKNSSGLNFLKTTYGAFERISNGADLMLPGVIPSFGIPDFVKGDILGVSLKNSPAIAIGLALISSNDYINSNYLLKGKAMAILHTHMDYLWEFGSKHDPKIRSFAHPSELDYVDDDILNSSSNSIEKNSVNLDIKTETESIKETPMDKLLEMAIFTAIKLKAPKEVKEYPIPSSVFYSSYILPSRIHNSTLDIKQSSYKKLSKFIKVYEKKGILNTKERAGDLVITSVDVDHPLITNFKPISEPIISKKPTVETIQMLGIRELFKPQNQNVEFFEALKYSKDTLFDAKQLRSLLDEYIAKNSLQISNNPRYATLDVNLRRIAQGKEEKEDALKRDEIHARLMSKMKAMHELSIGGEKRVVDGAVVPIVITLERRMGNKVVTRINGLKRFGIPIDTLASNLKLRCASACTVDSVNGNESILEIVVQGSKVEEVMKELEIYGIGSKNKQILVSIVDKVKKKK